MWEYIKNSKVVKFIIIVVIVVVVCWLLGLSFHGSAGQEGIDLGISHKSK